MPCRAVQCRVKSQRIVDLVTCSSKTSRAAPAYLFKPTVSPASDALSAFHLHHHISPHLIPSLPPSCRFEVDQAFPSLTSDFTVTMSVPDGDWQVVLNAPVGGVRGAVTAQNGNSMRIDAVLGSSASETLTSFGGCDTQDIVNGTDCGSVSVGGRVGGTLREVVADLVECTGLQQSGHSAHVTGLIMSRCTVHVPATRLIVRHRPALAAHRWKQ